MSPESPSSYWRNIQTRLRLIGEKCPHCKKLIFPPRDICPECGTDTETGEKAIDIPAFEKFLEGESSD